MEGVTQEAASLAGHLQSGQADLSVRRQPHLAGRRDRIVLHRRCGEAFRSVWLAHAPRRRRQRCGSHRRRPSKRRKRETRPAFADSGARRISATAARRSRTASKAHGNPLGEEELQAAKKALGWASMEKFYLPEEAVRFFREAIGKGAKAQAEWQKKFDAYKSRVPDRSGGIRDDLERQAARTTGMPICRNGSPKISRSRRASPAARR